MFYMKNLLRNLNQIVSNKVYFVRVKIISLWTLIFLVRELGSFWIKIVSFRSSIYYVFLGMAT